MKYILIVTITSLFIFHALAKAESTDYYRNYVSIIENDKLSSSEKLGAIDEGLRQLSKNDFLLFIREFVEQSKNPDDPETVGISMGVFAYSYLRGSGKGEPLLETLNQINDGALHYWWKMALLHALHLDKYEALMKPEDVSQVVILIGKCSLADNHPFMLRKQALRCLYRYISSQMELLSIDHDGVYFLLSRKDKSAAVQGKDKQMLEKWKAIIDSYNEIIDAFNGKNPDISDTPGKI